MLRSCKKTGNRLFPLLKLEVDYIETLYNPDTASIAYEFKVTALYKAEGMGRPISRMCHEYHTQASRIDFEESSTISPWNGTVTAIHLFTYFSKTCRTLKGNGKEDVKYCYLPHFYFGAIIPSARDWYKPVAKFFTVTTATTPLRLRTQLQYRTWLIGLQFIQLTIIIPLGEEPKSSSR